MNNVLTRGDSENQETKTSVLDEMQEHLDQSWEIICSRILDELSRVWNIDGPKIKKLEKLRSEKWNDYVNAYFKKVFVEVKNRLNAHWFPLQKRRTIVWLMKEQYDLLNILWMIMYKDLSKHIVDLFDKLLDQWNTTESSDFVKKHNEQQENWKKMRDFLSKHMDELSKLSSASTIVMTLFNYDSMTKSDILDHLYSKKTDKRRKGAEDNISKMIEQWMIKEEWEKLSLIY